MFKKIIILSMIFAGSLSTAWSKALYISPGIIYENIHASGSSYEGMVGSLNLGYGGWMHDNLYLAGEIFGNTKPHTYHESDDTAFLLKPGYAWGFSIIPAMNVQDAVTIYARLGYVRTKFQELNTTAGAYQAGLGAEAPLENCWSIRAEYVYSPYHSISGAGTIQFNQVTLALVYRFEPLLRGFTTDL